MLTNKDGVYYVNETPGAVRVNRACGELTIRCSKQGFNDFVVTVGSSVKAIAFGNILIGGLIGAGVDTITGAACDYPSYIPVPMDCGASDQQRTLSDHIIPEKVLELAEKEDCTELAYVGAGLEQETVYQARCVGESTLLTCDEKGCGKSKIEVIGRMASAQDYEPDEDE